MKKRAILYSIVALASLATVYLFFFQEQKQEIAVETVPVKTGTITNMITATGTIEPTTKVEVGTQVSGVIEKIYVDYNSEVKKGQLIAELEKTALRATVTEVQANLNSAKNELQYQQTNFDRTAKLYEAKVVSRTDYEEALYTLNNAKAVVAQRTSELKRAQTNLNFASIYSPVDGVVLSRAVDEGQTVAASYSTPTLFTIAQDLTKMQVEANVDEADIGQVKEGEQVTFTVDAYPHNTFAGKVTQVRKDPVVESKVVTYTVIIEAGNPDGKLMPGLTASTSIVTEEVTDVLTLEAAALRFEPNGEVMQAYLEKVGRNEQSLAQHPVPIQAPVHLTSNTPSQPAAQQGQKKQTVWVKSGQEIRPVQVTTGMTDGASVEIRKGLKAGDEVVTSMEVVTANEATAAGSTGSSPFMPTPPGRNRTSGGGR